ncbi:hypothetical protein B0H13DRAFT_2267842 [Mycena leptocephala]|nr:hypothetical protein B0H13DRAFT_2267842 [Mycena leptocephala]
MGKLLAAWVLYQKHESTAVAESADWSRKMPGIGIPHGSFKPLVWARGNVFCSLHYLWSGVAAAYGWNGIYPPLVGLGRSIPVYPVAMMTKFLVRDRHARGGTPFRTMEHPWHIHPLSGILPAQKQMRASNALHKEPSRSTGIKRFRSAL